MNFQLLPKQRLYPPFIYRQAMSVSLYRLFRRLDVAYPEEFTHLQTSPNLASQNLVVK